MMNIKDIQWIISPSFTNKLYKKNAIATQWSKAKYMLNYISEKNVEKKIRRKVNGKENQTTKIIILDLFNSDIT